MSPAEQAPPEGALIRLARKARGLSVNKAVELVRERAPDIRLGESRWYHIEGGTEGKGKPVIAPDDTLAHMAYVVGLTPERLTKVGREDAAEILEEIIRQAQHETPQAHDPQLHRILDLWPRTQEWQRRSIAGVLEEMLRETPSVSDTSHDKKRTG